MTVYVDELRPWFPVVGGHAGRHFGGGRESCHLSADTLDELHAFALRIGMRRGWFQNHPIMPHYDLTPAKRAAAVKLGAREVTAREQARKRWEARQAAKGVDPATKEHEIERVLERAQRRDAVAAKYTDPVDDAEEVG